MLPASAFKLTMLVCGQSWSGLTVTQNSLFLLNAPHLEGWPGWVGVGGRLSAEVVYLRAITQLDDVK